jgi:DNA invertase Pin-like site-specific DNA recombinase
LDRLARNVRFIATLMDGNVEFVCCDMPQATRLTIHVLAAVAEHEREMIVQRTKDGLAAAKARGVKRGIRSSLQPSAPQPLSERKRCAQLGGALRAIGHCGGN